MIERGRLSVGFGLICVAALMASPEVRCQEDTLPAARSVSQALRYHYIGGRRWGSRGTRQPYVGVDSFCDGGSGALCHGGDPDRGYCPANVLCHPTEEFLLDALLEAAVAAPESGYVLGQAVYALSKFGFHAEAAELVQSCRADPWWCEALEGYVLVREGAWGDAEVPFRKAMEGAPVSVRCAYLDATWLLGEWDQRRGGVNLLPPARQETQGWSCARRLAVSDTVFWLADPLYHQAGNVRWAEHIARAMNAQFSLEIRQVVRGGDLPQRYREYDWAMEIRRGSWDSYQLPPGGAPPRFWTSSEKARYSFVPLVEAGDLSNPVWTIEEDILKEGFTPEDEHFHPLKFQLARFRAGDSIRLAASADLMASPLGRATRATAYLVLSDGPERFPLRLEEELRRANPVFLGMSVNWPSVVGVEVTTNVGIGWVRQTVVPLEGKGPEVSDLLLYRPTDTLEVGSLEDAFRTMLPSDSFEAGARLGVFWETYGAPDGEMVQFDLSLERRSGGVVERLAAVLSGGRREGRGRVGWAEPSSGAVHPRGIVLDISSLRRGEYRLVLRAQWPGQATLERSAPVSIGE